jgi:excisionase family DNA binding protein
MAASASIGRMKDDPDTYTVAEVAAKLECSEDAIYQACRRGEFPHVKIGRLTRIPRRRFHAWVNDGPSEIGPAPVLQRCILADIVEAALKRGPQDEALSCWALPHPSQP